MILKTHFCFRYVNDLEDTFAYWGMDMVGLSAWRFGFCTRRMISLYTYIWLNQQVIQATPDAQLFSPRWCDTLVDAGVYFTVLVDAGGAPLHCVYS